VFKTTDTELMYDEFKMTDVEVLCSVKQVNGHVQSYTWKYVLTNIGHEAAICFLGLKSFKLGSSEGASALNTWNIMQAMVTNSFGEVRLSLQSGHDAAIRPMQICLTRF
jgi:hypothetical protein